MLNRLRKGYDETVINYTGLNLIAWRPLRNDSRLSPLLCCRESDSLSFFPRSSESPDFFAIPFTNLLPNPASIGLLTRQISASSIYYCRNSRNDHITRFISLSTPSIFPILCSSMNKVGFNTSVNYKYIDSRPLTGLFKRQSGCQEERDLNIRN